MEATLLLVLGGIIGVGFAGSIFLEKTRVPDVFLLMAVGVLIGPVLRIVPPETVRPFMPVFGTLALTIILFEGGLNLDLGLALRQAGRAMLLMLLSFTVSACLVYYALHIGLEASGPMAWAVSAAVACTSAPIVIPVLARLAPDSPLRPLLSMESALSDALAVMVVLTIGIKTGGGFSGPVFVGLLGRSVLIGAGAAAVGGLLWLLLLLRLYERPFFYLMTLGFVFLLMGGVIMAGGSGAVAALVFGMVLANGEALYALLHPSLKGAVDSGTGEGRLRLHPRITESHSELSFVTRTFFFVYLGMIVRWPEPDFRMWLTLGLATVAILVGREIAVQLTGWVARIPARERVLLSSMVPRGLATAVLVSMLASRSPDSASSWVTLATFLILVSNLHMTLRLVRMHARPARGVEEAA